jgi:hypothetical protein
VADFLLVIVWGRQVLASLALGYSDVDYLRSVPRKKLEVEYI